MALSRLSNYTDGIVASGTDVQNEFSNIYDNPIDLWSPAAKAADMNGEELILDADGDTSLTADTDDQIDVRISGADDFRLTANTLTALSGSTISVPSGATLACAVGSTINLLADITMTAGDDILGGVGEILFNNDAGGASATGRLRRNAANLTFHDGTASRNLIRGIGQSIGAVEFIRKTGTETVTGSSTIQVDNELLAAIAANETLLFELHILHVGNGTADFKLAISGPSGAAGFWANGALYYTTADASAPHPIRTTFDNSLTMSISGSTDIRHQLVWGLVRNGATPGNVALYWAQDTPDGVNTQVLLDSYMMVWRQ